MNEYRKRIAKLQDYNDYHINENEKHLEEITKQFKKNVAECNYPSSMVNLCEQFIYRYRQCELNETKYNEVSVLLMNIESDFEKMEEKENES